MKKKQWFGVIYVSIWVLIWGTLGSLIDLPFLKSEVYQEGSFGQATTFFLTAIGCSFIGYWLYPKVLASKILVGSLGLDTDSQD